MSYDGRRKVFGATFASGATSTGEVDLSGYYGRLGLEIPAGVAADIRILGSRESAGTFRNVFTGWPDNDSSPAVFNIASSVSNCQIAVPGSSRFVKLEATTAIADGATFYLTTFD